ncbi:MAG: hypothetical protein C4K60_20290 [Ideonella sp. MAG2]|nr:MAG: hypothetical protein C4K60_20290 [Ideonella sp. MAG2]
MSYSASDLQMDVDRLLDRLGLEVTGDDEEGFTVCRGGKELTYGRLPVHDTAAEAAAAALEDLIDRVEELMSAAKTVIDRWEDGDLAEAVRELVLCVRTIDEVEPGEAGAFKTAERLKTRLQCLQRDGLSFGDCVQAFGCTDDEDPAVGQAHRIYHQAGDIELESTTVVSRFDGYGAYVLAWVFVPEPLESWGQVDTTSDHSQHD